MKEEFYHEIDEIESSNLTDIINIKEFNSNAFNECHMTIYHGINRPSEFHSLSKEEIERFKQFGIDGDNLRICNEFYINLYGDKFTFDSNGKLIKSR